MQLEYLGNSGFCMDFGGAVMVVDCFDPQRHPALKERIQKAKQAVIVASHAHLDHYNPGILKWLQPNVLAVLSSDIKMEEGTIAIAPGQAINQGGFDIRAFSSTDEGVSFLIKRPPVTVFHAGDLNNWHWKDESSPEEARQAEQAFLKILDEIVALKPSIDVALFPVDPRMGTDYYRGAVQFAKALRPRFFVPMHFGRRFDAPAGFFDEMAQITTLIVPEERGWTHGF